MAALLSLPSLATAQVSSAFDTNTESWTAVDMPTNVETNGYSPVVTGYTPTWNSSAGNPSGYVSLTDPTTTYIYYFTAPSAYLGNKADYFGGTLSYDLKVTGSSLTAGATTAHFVLVGGGLTLVMSSGVVPPVSSTTWTTYTVGLQPSSAWHISNLSGATPTTAQFLTVLGALDAIYIRGEHYSGVDTCGLDNVSLRKPFRSGFETSADGWEVAEISGTPESAGYAPSSSTAATWSSTAGYPGGAITSTDTASTLFYFKAPAKFLGAKAEAFNGVLTFDLRVAGSGLSIPSSGNVADVVLVGNGLTLVIDAGVSPDSGGAWRAYSVGLRPSSAWHVGNLQGAAPTQAQFQGVLGALDAIYVRGDYYDGSDTAYLDNVTIQAPASAGFSTTAEGWLGVDIAATPEINGYVETDLYLATFSATGGNPDGKISITDPSGDLFYFKAPANFLGDQLNYYGGALSFDLRVTGSSLTAITSANGDVVLKGGGITLVCDAGANPAISSSTWTHYSVDLSASGPWHISNLQGPAPTESQFLTVLGALDTLYIRGEYYTGTDTAHLDNVKLNFSAPSNLAPVANAGNNQILLAGSASQLSVTLNGSASTDPENDSLTYAWTGPFGTATGVSPSVTLPLGINTVTLTVQDSQGATGSATVQIGVAAGYAASVVDGLNQQIATLTATNTALTTTNADLTAANATLTSANATLTAANAALTAANQDLQGKVDQLRAQKSSIASQLQTALTQLAAVQTTINAALTTASSTEP